MSEHGVGDYFNAITTGLMVGAILAIIPGIIVGFLLSYFLHNTSIYLLLIGVIGFGLLGFVGGFMGSLDRADKKKEKKLIRKYQADEAREKTNEIHCPECGGNNMTEAQFCSECGTNLIGK